MRAHYRCAMAALAAWLLFVPASPVEAQPAAPAGAAKSAGPGGSPKRPKVCLVLSGGGARGAAHIGVLRVLDEMRVPIHCVAGTSMGALVGGAYATGMSFAEMDEFTRRMSLEQLVREKPPRDELSMRRKRDDYTSLFSPEIGVGSDKATFTKGLVSGVQLETVLRQLSKVQGYHDFDKLPIPYRAVATDLVTGKAVVFKEGELANVMRASMSVPGAIAPAEFGGMILVDGMLTSNLPVETARAMGADVIIAVNVGTPLLKREELNGILGVAGQMLSILTEQNVQASIASLKPTDILISPELEGFSTADFDRLQKISALGEPAARKLADRLEQLSLPPHEYAALRRRQQVVVTTETQPVDEIRFEGLQRVNPATAQAMMETSPGKPIDQGKLDSDMRRIYGTGDFEHVNYRFLEERGRRVLAVDAVEKAWGPDYLRFGLGLSSDFGGDAYFNLLASYRKTWLNSLGAEWRTDVQFGNTRGLVSEFYQPLDPGAPGSSRRTCSSKSASRTSIRAASASPDTTSRRDSSGWTSAWSSGNTARSGWGFSAARSTRISTPGPRASPRLREASDRGRIRLGCCSISSTACVFRARDGAWRPGYSTRTAASERTSPTPSGRPTATPHIRSAITRSS